MNDDLAFSQTLPFPPSIVDYCARFPNSPACHLVGRGDNGQGNGNGNGNGNHNGNHNGNNGHNGGDNDHHFHS